MLNVEILRDFLIFNKEDNEFYKSIIYPREVRKSFCNSIKQLESVIPIVGKTFTVEQEKANKLIRDSYEKKYKRKKLLVMTLEEQAAFECLYIERISNVDIYLSFVRETIIQFKFRGRVTADVNVFVKGPSKDLTRREFMDALYAVLRGKVELNSSELYL